MNEQLRDLALLASFQLDFLFAPELWEEQRRIAETMRGRWKITKFPPVSNIPAHPAVYAFVVEPDLYNLTPANGLFYVGYTNNFRRRISEYKGELNKRFSTRPHVQRMVQQWNGYLKIYYRKESEEKAKAIEQSILAAFSPCFNKALPAGKARNLERAFDK